MLRCPWGPRNRPHGFENWIHSSRGSTVFEEERNRCLVEKEGVWERDPGISENRRERPARVALGRDGGCRGATVTNGRIRSLSLSPTGDSASLHSRVTGRLQTAARRTPGRSRLGCQPHLTETGRGTPPGRASGPPGRGRPGRHPESPARGQDRGLAWPCLRENRESPVFATSFFFLEKHSLF